MEGVQPVWWVGLAVVLVAGCSDGSRFPAHDETQHAEYPNFYGVVAEGRLTGGGSEVRIDAFARNDGPITYKVSSVCIPPWTESMQGRLGTVYPKGPHGYCHAFGLRDFPPGETIPYELTWNGTLWDQHQERFVRAEGGTYEWQLAFEAYGQCVGGQCELHDWIKLHFTVKVD